MDLDETLAKIAAQFGGKVLSEEDFTKKWVERGMLCSTCEKRYCSCKCGCKRCWGQG